MNTLASRASSAAIVALIAVAVVGSLLSQPGHAAPPPSVQQVLITNTSNQPVPVNGTMSAQQNGTWNVGFSSTPTVNVGNFPTTQQVSGNLSLDTSNPLKVFEIPGGQHVDAHVQFTMLANNFGDFTALLPINVGADQVFIVDHITAQVSNPAGQDINFRLFIHQTGSLLGFGHAFPAQPLGAATNQQQLYMASVDPHLSAPAGYELVAGVQRNFGTLASLFQGTVDYLVSGRLVDLQ